MIEKIEISYSIDKRHKKTYDLMIFLTTKGGYRYSNKDQIRVKQEELFASMSALGDSMPIFFKQVNDMEFDQDMYDLKDVEFIEQLIEEE